MILLHFGEIVFRIHFRKTLKPIIFTVFRASGHDHDSKNQYDLSLETPNDCKLLKKNRKPCMRHLIYGTTMFLEIERMIC